VGYSSDGFVFVGKSLESGKPNLRGSLTQKRFFYIPEIRGQSLCRDLVVILYRRNGVENSMETTELHSSQPNTPAHCIQPNVQSLWALSDNLLGSCLVTSSRSRGREFSCS